MCVGFASVTKQLRHVGAVARVYNGSHGRTRVEGIAMQVEIDVEAPRAYLLDYCGTAAFGGFPAAILDVVDVERAGGQELCRMAERLGVDLRRFAV